MYKVTVIGHYGKGFDYNDGQTVKTKSITKQLILNYGEDLVSTIDTHGGIKSLIKAPMQIHRAMRDSDNVIMLPAHRGVRVYAPIMWLYRKRYKKCKIFYIVVGGWLPFLLGKNILLRKCLNCYDGIFVETHTMKTALEGIGFQNIYTMPNFKDTEPIELTDQKFNVPYRLCTFSRVLQEKGIGDAVDTVNRINKEKKTTAFLLDIYGPIDSAQKEWFDNLQNSFGKSIQYRGTVPSEHSTAILKDYFALLFPTHYYTEGIPGTIVDSYAAGVPVICSKWESYSDVVDDQITGIGYEFDDVDGLYHVLSKVYETPEIVESMRITCQNRYLRIYSPKAIESLLCLLR